MSKGLSVHIGVKRVDPDHYAGWSGPLNACESDALRMQSIADACGYTSSLFLTNNATRENVKAQIAEAAHQLETGDIFMLTYSGHGGQVPDEDGDEEDGLDETWCLYDGQLIDDELYELWSLFKSGVRVLVLSDSCHSGSVIRNLLDSERADSPVDTQTPRNMPDDEAFATYRANTSLYKNIAKNVPSQKSPVSCRVRLISGCQDSELSYESGGQGNFTRAVNDVWNHGEFDGDYAAFHVQVVAQLNGWQHPNHSVLGAEDSSFDASRPFVI